MYKKKRTSKVYSFCIELFKVKYLILFFGSVIMFCK
jgi:hypothetical protein